jgi:hypothetical protein
VTTSVVLDDLIDALEGQSDSLHAFVDRDSGEVLLMSYESLSLGEAEPDEIASLPDWQKEEAKLAMLIQTTDRYLSLPDRFEVNEWNIMAEFCDEVKRADVRGKLLRAIRGSRPFRHFKDEIARHDLWKEWDRFRRQALGAIAREWCEENGMTPIVRKPQSARQG